MEITVHTSHGDDFDDLLFEIKDTKETRDPRKRRLASVTAAVGSCIEGAASPALYYAAAFRTLEGSLMQEISGLPFDTLLTQVALLELISLILPYVPYSVVSKTFGTSSRVLRAVVASWLATESRNSSPNGVELVLVAACRTARELLSRMRSGCPEEDIALILGQIMVVLFKDSSPKLRLEAFGAINGLLGEETCHPRIHHEISLFTKHSISQIKMETNENLIPRGESLYVLDFLGMAGHALDPNHFGPDLIHILRYSLDPKRSERQQSEYNDSIQCALLVLKAIWAMMPASAEDMPVGSGPSKLEFCKRVLATLLQMSELIQSTVDATPKLAIAYGTTSMVALQCIVEEDRQLAKRLFPTLFQTICSVSKPQRSSSFVEIAGNLMPDLEHLTRLVISEDDPADVDLRRCFERLSDCALGLLHPSFTPIWPTSLNTVAIICSHSLAPKECRRNFVKALCIGRSEHSHEKEIVDSVGATISLLYQEWGIEMLLNSVEWNATTTCEFDLPPEKAFILKALKTTHGARQSCPSHLSLFIDHVLPITEKCFLAAGREKHRVAFFRNRFVELWDLLPLFCTDTVDIVTTMPRLLAIIGKALAHPLYPQIIPAISKSMRLLVCQLPIKSEGPHHIRGDDDESLGRSVSSILPAFCAKVESLYQKKGEQDDGTKLPDVQSIHLKDSITALARICDPKLLSGIFKKALQKLLRVLHDSNESNGHSCSSLLICRAVLLSERVEATHVQLFFRTLKPLVSTDRIHGRVQKQAYASLSEMVENEAIDFQGFLDDLSDLLVSSSLVCHVSARRLRLRCIKGLFVRLGANTAKHTPRTLSLLGGVIISLKDPTIRTREEARDVLLSMYRLCGDKAAFFNAVLASLAAESSQMRSAGVNAVSYIVREGENGGPEVLVDLQAILRTVLLLWNDSCREVQKSVIGFVRLCIVRMDVESLRDTVPEIIHALFSNRIAKNRFKSKLRIVLKKFAHKFGYELLLQHVPDADASLLANLQKEERREARIRKNHATPDGFKMSTSHENSAWSVHDDSLGDDDGTFLSGASGIRTQNTRSGFTTKYTTNSRNGSVRRQKLNEARIINDTSGNILEIDDLVAKQAQLGDDMFSDDSSEGSIPAVDEEGRLVFNFSEPMEALPVSKKQRVLADDKVAHSSRKKKETSERRHGKTLGMAYKSRKAGGDVKRRGQKYEPYAFVPLSGKNYTRKNRRGAVDQMSSVVGGRKRKR